MPITGHKTGMNEEVGAVGMSPWTNDMWMFPSLAVAEERRWSSAGEEGGVRKDGVSTVGYMGICPSRSVQLASGEREKE